MIKEIGGKYLNRAKYDEPPAYQFSKDERANYHPLNVIIFSRNHLIFFQLQIAQLKNTWVCASVLKRCGECANQRLMIVAMNGYLLQSTH